LVRIIRAGARCDKSGMADHEALRRSGPENALPFLWSGRASVLYSMAHVTPRQGARYGTKTQSLR